MTLQRLLLVDDDHTFTDLLAQFLTSEGFSVTPVFDGMEALNLLSKASFDLCILDVMMPNLNGLETLKKIRQNHSNLPVLMLTAKSEPIDKILGLELGADDYLTKPPEPRELSARIKAILRRSNNPPQEEAVPQHNHLLEKIHWDDHKRIFYIDQQQIDLTGIEYEILTVLAQRMGSIVSKEEISLAALKRELQPFDRSLDVHISNIRKKVSDFNVKIKSIRGRGYQFII